MTALPTLKLRVLPTFPSSVVGSGPITVTKTAGIYTISFSIAPFGSIAPPPANYPTDFLLGYDAVAGTFFKLPLSLVLSGSAAQTGASYTYAVSDQALVKKRSNSAVAMVDTLPGTGTAVMAAGWWTRIVNTDAAAILAIGVGTGATLDGQAAGNFVYLGPGQAATVYSDGTNYITLEKPVRCRLGAATTIYAGGTGSSASNAGLSSGSGAFGTIQAAINFVGSRLDLGLTNNCTIQIADGNYTENLSLVPYVGRGSQGHTGPVIIQGNSGNITAVSLQPATGDAIIATETGGFEWAFQNLKIAPATGQVNIDAFAWVVFGAGITFGTTTSNHIVIQNGGVGEFTSNPNISGGAGSHLLIHSGGICIYTGGNTVTITNTPAFPSGFVVVVRGGKLIAPSVTYTGAVGAGPKWSRDTTSVLFTAGVDPDTVFPGTVNGSVSPSLPVNEGGTGVATLTNHGVLLGKGTSPIAATVVGVTGTVLRGQTGADPVYGAVVLTTDITGILPIANGGTNDTGTAWTTYTPSVASGGGVLTTASATGRFKQIGKTTFFQATVTITTNGTGASNIQVGLPATAAAAKYSVCGFESGLTGKQLSGVINASATTAVVTFYDNTYPGANGAVPVITGVYEAA